MKGILFLDIDGVLNGHQVLKSNCCGIDPACIEHLNHVLDVTNCDIVLSSAWRYMIHCGSMTLNGFWHMLRTHGLTNQGRGNPFKSLTEKDAFPPDSRGSQIMAWLDAHPVAKQKPWAVVDDMGNAMLELPKRHAWRLVQTNGEKGLQKKDVARLVHLLRYGRPRAKRAARMCP